MNTNMSWFYCNKWSLCRTFQWEIINFSSMFSCSHALSTKAPGLEKNSFEGNIVCVCSYVHRYGILWVYPTLTAQHKSINQVCTGQLRPNRFKYIVKRIFHVVKAQVLNLEVVTCQCSVSYIVTRNNRPICIKKFNYLLPVSCNN